MRGCTVWGGKMRVSALLDVRSVEENSRDLSVERLGWHPVVEGPEGHAKEFVVQMHCSQVGRECTAPGGWFESLQ